MLAARPTARPSLTLFEFLSGPSHATLSRRRLLRILDPADELVTGEWRDVVPRFERNPTRRKLRLKVLGKFMHGAAE